MQSTVPKVEPQGFIGQAALARFEEMMSKHGAPPASRQDGQAVASAPSTGKVTFTVVQ